ncbi:hypothetical protein ACFODZ_03535 [Marinicella sediminis]|uniref:DUF1471 domain-containing protein n=1 Tax=Marinicella sediminis TaxID=1792834 RepID=A0ABV7J566_9GAMM|nr:hypothetical protein [Marinicella sediminis]
MKLLLSSLFTLLCLTSAPVLAKNEAQEAAQKGLKAVTVYLDVNLIARKHRAAKNLTELHQEFAAYGYELIQVNPYTENSDLQGFYVSYKKAAN